MSRRRAVAALLAAAVIAVGLLGMWRASVVDTRPADRAAQVLQIGAGLRCPVCQSSSVADSPSEMAKGMRRIIDEQLAAGRTPEQVQAWFVDRYGSWILLDPPARGPGAVLWALPVVALAGGVTVARRWTRRERPVAVRPDEPGEPAVALLADVAAGRVDPGQGAEAERLIAAAVLLHDVETEPDPSSTRAAGSVARAEAAAAVVEWRAEQARLEQARLEQSRLEQARRAAGHSAPTPPGAPPRRGARLAWTALVTAFAVTLAMLLLPSLRARTGTDQITGDPLGQPVPASAQEPVEEPAPPPTPEELAAAVAADPADVPARLAYGDLLDAQGRLAEATEQYRAAQQAAPAEPAPAIRLAFALQRGGDAAGARALLDDVLRRTPDEPDALLLLGTIQLRTADPAGRARLERFLQVAPDHPAARQVRDALSGALPGAVPGGPP